MIANRTLLKHFRQFFFLFLVAALSSACSSGADRSPESSPSEPLPAKSAEGESESIEPLFYKDLPTGHVWQYLYSYGGEEAGYAAYSYVLVGRENNEAAFRYSELVKAITISTVGAGDIPAEVSKSSFNIFLIPQKTKDVESHTPDYELSKLLLAAVSATSKLKTSRPGPYIITLYQPISFGEKDDVADILYIDLTNVHPKSFPEVVSVYKNKIVDERLTGIEKLKSLKLSLLNIALITEDNIGFARTAYAELKSSFSPPP